MDVTFYLDVQDEWKNVTAANVTNILRQAATNDGFKPLKVKSITLRLRHVVGELSLISEERLCVRERERERTLQESFFCCGQARVSRSMVSANQR